MQWFLFDSAAYDEEGPFPSLPQKILDNGGKPFDTDEPYDGENQIRRDLHVRDASDAFIYINPRHRIGDVLNYPYHGNRAFSQQALQAFDSAGLVLDPNLYRWPLHIMEPKGKLRCEYFFLWALKRWRVLDLERSEVELSVNPKRVRKVRRWVLDPQLLPPYDLFAEETCYRWIASENLKQIADENQLVGMSFCPVE